MHRRLAEFERVVLPLRERMMRTVWRVARDPDLAEEAFQATGGAAWGDGPLSLRERSLIVIAILASLGGVEQRLVGHVRWAIDHGATADEVRSTMTLVANYAGFARASVAMEVANRELDRLDGSDDGVETTWRERW